MASHIAIATTAKSVYEAITVPTEKPDPDEILLKNEFACVSGFDVYVVDEGWYCNTYPVGLGIGVAGTVVEVGTTVQDLKVGDRVLAFAYGGAKNLDLAFAGTRERALQEYSIQHRSICSKISDKLSLEAAATVPDNFTTAFYTLFSKLPIPIPSSFPASNPPMQASAPILVYGGGSTTAQYAIQLLSLAGYKNIIVAASPKHHEYLCTLGARTTLDYNSPTLTEDIAKAAGGNGKIHIVMDAITTQSTIATIAKVMDPKGYLALLLPIKEGNSVVGAAGSKVLMAIPEDDNPLPEGITHVGIRTFLYQEDSHLKASLLPKILPDLLNSGNIKPNRVRLLEKGTLKERVEIGMDLVRNNRVSNEKIVVKITV